MEDSRVFDEEELKQKKNVEFSEFYKEQGIYTESWDKTLRTNLPVVIRVNNSRSSFTSVNQRFYNNPHWKLLSWFPGECVRQCVDFKYYIKDIPFKKWTKKQNVGYTLRYQEAVSLIPPLLLDLHPDEGQLVLDMCAAPGSKTLECIELLQKVDSQQTLNNNANNITISNQFCIVANDMDPTRCQRILSLIVRKTHSPCVLVTQSNAAKFPIIFEKNTEKNNQFEQLLFDRVLADVPCSGDGTLRKNPAIWNTWSNAFALELHAKQVKILLRGLHLLKENGRLVYSTCSMNPLENEAVVRHALRTYGDTIHLLNAHELFDQLKNSKNGDNSNNITTHSDNDEVNNNERQKEWQAHPGMTFWKVPYRKKQPVTKSNDDNNPTESIKEEPYKFYSDWREIPDVEQIVKERDTLLKKSMFAGEESENSMLKNCMRIHPDQNNTGGFFIAVFTKTSHWQVSNEMINDPPTVDIVWRGRNQLNRYEFLDRDENDEWKALVEFYGLSPDIHNDVSIVSEFNIHGRWSSINCVSTPTVNFLKSRFQGKRTGPLLTFVGVPLMKRIDDHFLQLSPIRWRLTQESGRTLSKFMTKRLLRLQKPHLLLLLQNKTILVETLFELAANGSLSGFESCEEKIGPVIVGVLVAEAESEQLYEDIWVPCIITGKQMMVYGRMQEFQHVLAHLQTE